MIWEKIRAVIARLSTDSDFTDDWYTAVTAAVIKVVDELAAMGLVTPKVDYDLGYVLGVDDGLN